MWSSDFKIPWFFKKLQIIAQRLETLPPDPFNLRHDTLNYTILLNTSPNLDIFAWGWSPLPWAKSCFKCQTRPGLLIFHSSICLSHEKFRFWKLLMTLLHVNCGLGLPITNPGYTDLKNLAFWFNFESDLAQGEREARYVGYCNIFSTGSNYKSKSDNKVTRKKILDQYHTGTLLSSTALRKHHWAWTPCMTSH